MMAAQRFSLAPLEPYWHRGRIWWSERSLREQVLLAALVVIAVFALLIGAVIEPLRSERAEALERIRTADLLEARLRAGGAGLATGVAHRTGTASAIITDSISAAPGLKIERIGPDGANTRVVLSDAPFDAVLKWVSDVEQFSRLRVVTAQIERKPTPGNVSATVVFGG